MSQRLRKVKEFTEKQMDRDANEVDIHLVREKKEIYEVNYEHFKPDQNMFSNFKSRSESSLVFEHEVIKEIKRSTKNIQKLDKSNDRDDSETGEGLFHVFIF